jgi:hypothetical protein
MRERDRAAVEQRSSERGFNRPLFFAQFSRKEKSNSSTRRGRRASRHAARFPTGTEIYCASLSTSVIPLTKRLPHATWSWSSFTEPERLARIYPQFFHRALDPAKLTHAGPLDNNRTHEKSGSRRCPLVGKEAVQFGAISLAVATVNLFVIVTFFRRIDYPFGQILVFGVPAVALVFAGLGLLDRGKRRGAAGVRIFFALVPVLFFIGLLILFSTRGSTSTFGSFK